MKEQNTSRRTVKGFLEVFIQWYCVRGIPNYITNLIARPWDFGYHIFTHGWGPIRPTAEFQNCLIPHGNPTTPPLWGENIDIIIYIFQMKICDVFLIFAQNIECGYSFKLLQGVPKICFTAKIRKNMYTGTNLFLLYKRVIVTSRGTT